MHFRITPDAVELVEPEDVSSFYAVCSAELQRDDLAETARRAGLGEVLPGGGHLMVPLETIRRMAADRVGPSWEEAFQGMIAYASKQGWLNDDGTCVRGHLERAEF